MTRVLSVQAVPTTVGLTHSLFERRIGNGAAALQQIARIPAGRRVLFFAHTRPGFCWHCPEASARLR